MDLPHAGETTSVATGSQSRSAKSSSTRCFIRMDMNLPLLGQEQLSQKQLSQKQLKDLPIAPWL